MEENVSILIDFDNIIQNPSDTMASILAIVDLLLDRVLDGAQSYAFDVRLYAGWDELVVGHGGEMQNITYKMSRHAEDVLRNIPGTIIRWRKKHLVTVTIARALFENPRLFYVGTYRRKQISYKLVVGARHEVCCDEARTHYDFLHTLIKKRKCHFCNQKVQYVSTSEQKLVDSLLCIDAFTLGLKENVRLVLASDDDDFIPVIFHLVAKGKSIIHLRREESPTYLKYVQDAEKVLVDFSSNYRVVLL